jgi:serine O-acetyltransferase
MDERKRTDMDLILSIHKDINKVLDKYLPADLCETYGLTTDQIQMLELNIYSMVFDDLYVLTTKDPAAGNRADYAYQTYTSFRAVLYYRIANSIYYNNAMNNELKKMIARSISEDGKVITNIDINPCAKIGRKFVIDHGMGTVIGETCEIGENCYILQNVVLGARGIACNPQGKRHPQIGDNVEIGGFTRIFGPIKIGNNVIISPNCVINHDIPSDSEVVIINQLQIQKKVGAKSFDIYGIVPDEEGCIKIYGEHLSDAALEIIDENFEKDKEAKLTIIEQKEKYVKVRLTLNCQNSTNVLKRINIRIIKNDCDVVILEATGLKRVIKRITGDE